MRLSYEDHEAVTVLTLSGELTIDQVDAFRRACLDRFEAGVRDVVLDVENLRSIDSAGLELLLWLADEVAARSGQLKLVRPDSTVATILGLTRLDRRFDIADSIETAARSLR